MKNAYLKLLVLTLVFAFTLACSKDDDNQDKPEAPIAVTDVYAVGYEQVGSNARSATIWKNGIATHLTNGATHAQINDVFVSGADVYMAGSEVRPSPSYDYDPIFWKNGEKTVLPTYKGRRGIANAVYVYNGNIFIAGVEIVSTDTWQYQPVLWRNGVRIVLDGHDIDTFQADDIIVNDDDVYVVGTASVNDVPHAVLWKNGVKTALTNQVNYSRAYSVAISGNDIYVAGIQNGTATLWKNGVASPLSVGTSSSISLYVSGNDIYTTGNSSGLIGSYGQYSKNSAPPVTLSPKSNFSLATSIFVSATDVYVGGYIKDETSQKIAAVYWKNGEEVFLTDLNGSAVVRSIFVTKN